MPGLLNPFTAALLSVAHLALATAVTVHVLAHNRNSGSAIAWIGLAWLSPVFGSLLYLLLGINRVQRRARVYVRAAPDALAVQAQPSTSPDDQLAPLERAAFQISQRPVAGGNAVTLLHNGDEAYPEMLAAIDVATTSVALSTYIFRTDIAGNSFIAALMRARDRGLEIRVLIDGYGGGYLRSNAYRALHRAGIRAARFMHSAWPWRMPFLNLRTHRKILVIDGRIAFMGGLNIGAENLLKDRPRHPVIDTHFKIAGPVVAQLCDSFAEQWYSATGEILAGAAWFPTLEAIGEGVARAVTSGPNQDIEKIELLTLAAIGCARASIQIMTPYFLPDDRLITALALAAMRGIEVDIVLPEHSNHPTVDWAMHAQIGPLLSAGCRVWTHAPPFDHSKLMAVDASWCFVGSSNWDMRSFRLNFEINLEIYGSAVVREIGATIAAKRTTRLTSADLARRPVLIRLRDSGARLMLPYL